jgi:1-acyl-sn-glycerol-3-phosphate acyltransferase
MPHPLAYVFKRELLYIPFFGWAIGSLDMVHIDRSRRSEAWRKVVQQGGEIMAKGSWMIMFPEGTRTARGSQGDYKSGASRLAVTTGTPLVPIAVTSARCWPRKSFLLRPGVIDVSIGAPISPVGRRPEELMKEVEAWIEGEMRRLDPEAYPSA